MTVWLVSTVKEQHMDLRETRKRRGWSIYDLAERTGVAASNISALETGSRILGKRLASRFAEHLDADSTELLIANQIAAMKRATRGNDALAILTCAKAIVEAMGDHELTDEDEKPLDQLVNEALAFAEKVVARANMGEDYLDTITLALVS